jgi:O-methyltransferase
MSVSNKLRRIVKLAQGDDRLRYEVAGRLARAIHPDAVLGEPGKRWMREDHAFLEAYSHYYPNGLGRRVERLYALDQLVKQALTVPGDTAECGVWHGAASHMIMRQTAGTGRLHHMFDSWEGISEPGPTDGSYLQDRGKHHLSIDESVARKNLEQFSHGRFYRGWIPTRFEEVSDRRFCLVHLDVDLYDPTMATLEFFYPRMNAGGLMICDDSGLSKCPGARLAMEEFFARTGEPVIDLPTGQQLVIVRPKN